MRSARPGLYDVDGIDVPDRCSCGARLTGAGAVEGDLDACARCGEATCTLCEGFHAGEECEPKAADAARRAACDACGRESETVGKVAGTDLLACEDCRTPPWVGEKNGRAA